MSYRILLLSSDRQLSRNTAAFLKLKGYNVSIYSDPQQAVVAADSIKPHLAVVDLALASRSGIEFLYELRSYPDWQSIPVIIMGNQHLLDIEPYLEAFTQLNISQYLSRPLTSLQKLEQEVERLLRAPQTA